MGAWLPTVHFYTVKVVCLCVCWTYEIYCSKVVWRGIHQHIGDWEWKKLLFLRMDLGLVLLGCPPTFCFLDSIHAINAFHRLGFGLEIASLSSSSLLVSGTCSCKKERGENNSSMHMRGGDRFGKEGKKIGSQLKKGAWLFHNAQTMQDLTRLGIHNCYEKKIFFVVQWGKLVI